MVQSPSRDAYYQEVASAFDNAASSYDELYQANCIMDWMRQESLAAIRGAFAPGSRLLEVGCGTGDEALALSRAGYEIVATDISPAMIDAARAKARATGARSVTWLVMPAGELAGLADRYPPGSLQGAYSSFGALNCEPDLAPVAGALASLLSPGALLVCSIMNRWSAWEIGWGLSRLHPRQAFRRHGRGCLDAGLASPDGGRVVPVRYYTPAEFSHALAAHFRLRRVTGLPVALPPPYLAHVVANRPATFARLERIDRGLRDRVLFRAAGDHFLAVLERTA